MSRLIDADAEIAKIKSEIERIEEEIAVWKDRDAKNDAGMYDVDRKIELLRGNITSCKMEIAMLRSYPTAFDVDKVIEQMEHRIANFDCKSCKYNLIDHPYCGKDCSDALIDGLLEIVKGGGVE